jgi:hypothetical protein
MYIDKIKILIEKYILIGDQNSTGKVFIKANFLNKFGLIRRVGGKNKDELICLFSQEI